MVDESLQQAKRCLIQASSVFEGLRKQGIGVTHPEYQSKAKPANDSLLLAVKIVNSYERSAEAFLEDASLTDESRNNLERAYVLFHEAWSLLTIDFSQSYDLSCITQALSKINDAEKYWNITCTVAGREKCALMQARQGEMLRRAA